jgi:hypothetical protein
MGLILCIDLIDPLLEQRTKDLTCGLDKQLAKGCLHLQQRHGQILQQRIEHYAEFFGERLV